MGHKYSEIAFTNTCKAMQRKMGSRAAYARRESGPDTNDRLGPDEEAFIVSRDGFYIASVSETGWPYVQFRGGPSGFLRVLDERTLGYADFRGNKQYITTANVIGNDRVALFLMDYAHRERLKILVRRAQSEGIQRLLDDALLNPDTAALLLKENNPANRAALARRAKIWMGNEASTLIDILDEQPDDDLKGMIMRDRNRR
jgi:Pyridoxamine 5'-phosphate oxidase